MKAGEGLVVDRQSADYSIVGQAVRDNLDVIIRWPRQSFKAVMGFFPRPDQEKLVTLTVPHRRRTPKYVTEQNLPETMEVRGLKVKLESGELKPTMTASKTALH